MNYSISRHESLLTIHSVDPRVSHFPLMDSPFPVIIIIFFWFKFILQWGPNYMKTRPPMELKQLMIVYNIIQIVVNTYLFFYIIKARNVIDWSCASVDYSGSYWGMTFVKMTYLYFLLKIFDLLDTVFFVLRKKDNHVSFLHTYHHFGMVCVSWIGTKFVAGGHSYFLGLANAPVHVILYLYYLLTSYDSKFGKILWLKKFITQAQLIQFAFMIYKYGQLFVNDCDYPKVVSFFLVPQNIFMIVLFGDFYVKTYILAPKRRKKQLEDEKEHLGMDNNQTTTATKNCS
ncbi:hypothetical protein ABEB36_011639 [Hypothenemus hampei]|uniref:Elongation of very long chain fatty acids protein n=1 Tax=Hypothenemus hampei TaxID=57062 RepID=A0ABD1E8J2_HYPHA